MTSSGSSSRRHFNVEQLETRRLLAATPVLPDPNGLGSYASEPPTAATNADLNDFVFNKQWDWINRPANSPLPTNDWWTNILNSGFTGNTWPLPLRVNNAAGGVEVTAFPGINASGGNITPAGGQGLTVAGQSGTFTRDALVNYGDWTLKYRMEQSASAYVDVTMGRGLPTVWFEFSNISPRVSLAGNFPAFNASGTALGNTFTTDQFRIDKNGRSFGVFAPAGTTFTLVNGGYNVTFSGSAKFLAISALPDNTTATFNLFAQHAYAIPRSSTYGWSYNATAGAVSTTWNLTTEALKAGASTDVIQGWLPHNYRDITSGPSLLSGYQYATIQGPVKLSVGKSFTIVQPTNGVNFTLAAPRAIGGTSDYNAAQMASYLTAYNKNYKSASDTYWGGKILQETAELTLMAQQLNDPNYARLLSNLKTAVTDWLTYTPGENGFYYAYYNKDKALVGFNTSFGSEKFTDHHFHYGYLTAAAGVLAMLDPAFADDYGAMATFVAKEYANWDRSDTRTPFLRTFDPWSGHSYAGGTGDGRGNNQESTSEAIQSWLGLVILGQALNDPAMTAAGMMGYTVEAKAENEYWLDIAHNDLTPDSFGRPSVAINYDDARQYQTFFGLNPEYSLGILGLPLWPSMDFLGKYKTNMQSVIDAMFDYRKTYYNNPDAGTYASFETVGGGTDWFNVILGMQMQVNPQIAANEYARVWSAQTNAGKDALTGLYYYQAQSYRSNGLRDWNYHLSLPLGGVYTDAAGKRTYVVYNPNATATTVSVYNASGAVVETFSAAPRKVTVTKQGSTPPPPQPGTVKGVVFNDVDKDRVRDSGEPGLGGRTIYADLNNNGLLDTDEQNTSATTDGGGNYTLGDLPTGRDLIIRQVLPTGWSQSTPQNNYGQHVTLSAGATATGKNFGAFAAVAGGTVAGVVFNDSDNDRTRDANEPGLSGRTVYVDLDNDGVLDSSEPKTTTVGDGSYSINGLQTGKDLIVRQVIPAGWSQTTPANNWGQHVTLSAGATAGGKNFGARQSATRSAIRINVGGAAYTDTSGNKWEADRGFSGGTVPGNTFAVGNTSNDILYSTRRYASSFTYTLAAVDGAYTLKLYFTEPSVTKVGQRRFDVTAEGSKILSNYDIYAQVGLKNAAVKQFNIIVTGGALNLSFNALADNAIVSGIELIPV